MYDTKPATKEEKELMRLIESDRMSTDKAAKILGKATNNVATRFWRLHLLRLRSSSTKRTK